jgi:hypothetical protein
MSCQACQKRSLIFPQASSSVHYRLMHGCVIASAGWAAIEFPDDEGAVEQEVAIMLDVVKGVKCTRVYLLPIPSTVHLLQNIQAWCPEPSAHKSHRTKKKYRYKLIEIPTLPVEQCTCYA